MAGLVLLVVAVLAAVAAAIVVADAAATTATNAALTPESAKTAIQDYLDALAKGDDETIARQRVVRALRRDQGPRSDMALANLASDAFRRQFGSAEVTSIDKIVTLVAESGAGAVHHAGRNRRAAHRSEAERQAVAQLLIQDNHILVCSYLPRAGQY